MLRKMSLKHLAFYICTQVQSRCDNNCHSSLYNVTYKLISKLLPSLNRLSGCCGMKGFLLFHQEGTCGKVILKNKTVIVPIKKIKKNLLTKVPIIKGMTRYKIQKFTSTPSLYTRCARAF